MTLSRNILAGVIAAAAYLLTANIFSAGIIPGGHEPIYFFNTISINVLISHILAMVTIVSLAVLLGSRKRKELVSVHPESKSSVNSGLDFKGEIIPEMLAHQIKTSLTTIIGFSALIKEGSLAEQTKDIYNDYIYTSSNNLLQTYRNLSDLQKITENRTSVKSEKCQVIKLLEETGKMQEQGVDTGSGVTSNLKLSVSWRDRRLLITTDCSKLKTVLNNLLQNAMLFSPEGNVEYGYLLEDQETIKFFVRDTGQTPTMEKMVEAYEYYTSKSKGIDAGFNLAALRLIVAKKFTELMGGKLWSEKSKKRGNIFYVTLPLSHSSIMNVSVPDTRDIIPDWSARSFLVADDVETNYLLIKELLRETRVHLTWAKNGAEAMEFFRNDPKKYDAVILDIVMPEMDGFEVASEIRKSDKVIPVIGQTAYSLENDHEIAKMYNFSDFLTKPIWYHDLVNTLQKHIENSKA